MAVTRARSASQPGRALGTEEIQTVRAVLNSERFQDCSPAAINATLLDEGQYLCSTRTMYRILEEDGAPRASVAINSPIRNITSRNFWPPPPTNFGVGTSLNTQKLKAQGQKVSNEVLAALSPYLTSRIPTPAPPNAGPPSVRPQASEGRDGRGGYAPAGSWWRF